MIRTLTLGAAVVALAAGAAVAQPRPYEPAPMSGPAGAPPAPEFVRMAGQSDQFEIRSSEVAQRRAMNPRVRRFAAEMIRDHGMTTRGLMKAVRETGRTPPPPPPLRPDQMSKIADLRGLRGREFDRTYIDQQVDSHQEALTLMQGYASGGDVPPLRRAADKTVPIVQHHLDMAREMQSRMR